MNIQQKKGAGVYLDHAATTYCDPRVLAAMEPYWEEDFGNPSSLYRKGRRAKDALDNARGSVARILQCKPDEIIFTGGGTEAINLAMFGVLRHSNILENVGMSGGHGGHIVTSKIEHHAVLRSCEALEKEGFAVSYLPVDEDGLVSPEVARAAIRPDTILVSIMYANNEIGTIQPIEEIGTIVKRARDERKAAGNTTPIFFFTDACQAAGALDMNVAKLGVDLLVFNGSKIYGPKGVGVLYKKGNIRLNPLVYGGGQEHNMRSGTENVPGIVGIAKAIEISHEEKEKENMRLVWLRDYFIAELQTKIPKVVLNGHPTKRLPNNVNVSVLDIEGEAVLLRLDAEGIAIATGSACTSESLDPSHVILALGRPYEHAHSSLRFTLGRRTTKDDLDYVTSIFPDIVKKLRQISPVKMEVGQKAISHPEAFAGQGSKIKVGGRTYK
jgi:cysteine desulfurase